MNDYNINPFTKFDKDWAIVTAGTKDKFNSMTISWGSMGTIWNKKVITIYIRPERYTYEFIKNNDYFTVSFYDNKYKDKLLVFGTKSGKDIDKVKETNFTPKYLDNSITYEEAKETFICKKLYIEQMNKDSLPEEVKSFYGDMGESHYIILGEVIDKID